MIEMKKNGRVHEQQDILIILVASLAVATSAVISYFVFFPWITSDSSVYISLAESILAGRYTTDPGNIAADVLRPPALPSVLAVFYGVGFDNEVIVILQLILYILALFALYSLADDLKINKQYFLILASVYPFTIFYISHIGVEGWLVPMFVGLAILLSRQQAGVLGYIVAGLLSGSMALFRSDMMVLPLAVAFNAFIMQNYTTANLVVSLRNATAAILSAALVLTPYSIWNYEVFGEFRPTPIAAAWGNSLYNATWQEDLSHFDFDSLYAGEVTPRMEASGFIAEIAKMNREIGAPSNVIPFNPAEYSSTTLQIKSNEIAAETAISRIMNDPAAYSRHLIKNAWDLWNTSVYPDVMPDILKLLLRAISGVIAILGLAGLGLALWNFRRSERLARVAVLTVAPYLAHIPLHTEARYTAALRLPLLLFAAYSLWNIHRKSQTMRAK